MSIRLYPHDDLGPSELVEELSDQGRMAIEAGFDGVMTSEHHGGLPGYLPNPLQVAGFVLEDTSHGWAAPCPLLLPLRPTALVAEEAAWLNARHPGRVGVGAAAGALELDFEVAGLSSEEAVSRFKAQLPRLAAMLRGEDLGRLEGDPALRACRDRPIPVLSAAVSDAAARRAARCGVGILTEGMSSIDRLAQLSRAYREGGGIGPRVLTRRVWLGRPPTEQIRSQRRVYDSYAGGGAAFGEDQTVTAERGEDLAGQLHQLMERASGTALNLRMHLPGIPAPAIREQIVAIGDEVLPALRKEWPVRPEHARQEHGRQEHARQEHGRQEHARQQHARQQHARQQQPWRGPDRGPSDGQSPA